MKNRAGGNPANPALGKSGVCSLPRHVASLLFLMACQAGAQAQTSPGAKELYIRSLAATCATCHGTDGRAAASSSLPSIAGQDKSYLAAQLNAFRDGSRPATIMHQLTRAYQDAQIELLAEYFASQGK